jgi:hypothetical protein
MNETRDIFDRAFDARDEAVLDAKAAFDSRGVATTPVADNGFTVRHAGAETRLVFQIERSRIGFGCEPTGNVRVCYEGAGYKKFNIPVPRDLRRLVTKLLAFLEEDAEGQRKEREYSAGHKRAEAACDRLAAVFGLSHADRTTLRPFQGDGTITLKVDGLTEEQAGDVLNFLGGMGALKILKEGEVR